MFDPGRKTIFLRGGILLIFILSISSVASSSTILTASEPAPDSSTEQSAYLNNDLFPEPEALKPQVDFWIDIYTRYDSNEVVIHDNGSLDIIYEVVSLDAELGPNASRRAKNRFVNKKKKHYAKILRKLGRQKGDCKNMDECLVAALFFNQTGKSVYFEAARRTRTQIGLADRFEKGLEISGRYMKEMRRIFSENSLPLELLALPHVESSFNTKAYSKYGAAGIWQFTRSTGRRFMKINYTYDERLDPLLSTKAAAKLLKKNYATLGSWPLALTAYNHGLRGIKRAKKRHGDDITDIIENYKRRTFGFASKNFYAEFLAAARIMQHPEKYFGKIVFQPPLKYDTVTVRDYIPASIFDTHFGYDKKEIAALNPSLRRPVWNGSRRIPKGYEIRIPEGHGSRFKHLYETIPKSQRFKHQIRQKWYYVKRGDALSTIARKFRTTIASLQDLNGIDNRHRIYSGQKLEIPERDYKTRIVHADLELNRPSKKPEPVALAKKTVALKKDVEPLIKVTVTENATAPVTSPPFSNYTFESLAEEYGVIRVQPEETIGHYSYWSGVSVTKILRLNGQSRRRPIRLGQKIKVPLSRVSAEKFENRRYEYHLSVFEDFFSTYKVKKVDMLVVEKGQSLWTICNDEYDIPVWLVHLYNPDEPLDQLHPGQVIRLPVVGERES